MIDDEEGKKAMWTSRKQFKKCAPCPFKVCTFFSHTKKKRAHQYTTNHKNGTKKTKQKNEYIEIKNTKLINQKLKILKSL